MNCLILTCLLVAFVHQGQAAVTSDVSGSIVRVNVDSNVPTATIFFCFDGNNRKSEVYVEEKQGHTITNLTLCNTTFKRYDALLWVNRNGLPVNGQYLDFGEFEDAYSSAPYPSFNIGNQVGRVYNVYSYNFDIHWRYSITTPLDLSLANYMASIGINLQYPSTTMAPTP